MRVQRLSELLCARCRAPDLEVGESKRVRMSKWGEDLLWGTVVCRACSAVHPVLSGVLVLVPDPDSYLLAHAKGVSQLVPQEEFPVHLRSELEEAILEIEQEHIEEDLEAERVNALYLLTHYMNAREGKPWFAPDSEPGSTLIQELIMKYWDQGPFAQLSRWLADESARSGKPLRVIELGCGVGGFARSARMEISSYLGIDSSFASVAAARHFHGGGPYARALCAPSDLLRGPLAQTLSIPIDMESPAEFIVADLEAPPVLVEQWDASVVLNAIDMLEDPARLPEIQRALVRPGGVVFQSAPYVWHEAIAARLREQLPDSVRDSASAVRQMYEAAGLKVEEEVLHVPWLFFKHLRQLEIYSAHVFRSRRI